MGRERSYALQKEEQKARSGLQAGRGQGNSRSHPRDLHFRRPDVEAAPAGERKLRIWTSQRREANCSSRRNPFGQGRASILKKLNKLHCCTRSFLKGVVAAGLQPSKSSSFH
ncbi:hypothetical protein F5144DRAFT_280655 [Chaetomium tenue]|uniref:Uncharacterized protein n=1 Tax=Chaetomium tenue TaxID=1854479 RepID=A0ACB7P6R6_9PEZI|nr:hypothetical protein F5144DRAFT_280655 [Chaetomium globosum]